MMEDFNRDNAKIDAALANHPSAEFIRGGTTETEAERVALDMTGIDWSKYFLVIAEVALLGSDPVNLRSSAGSGWFVEIANNSVGSGSSVAYFTKGAVHQVLIPVLYRADAPISALSIGQSASFSAGSGPLGQTEYFYLDACSQKTIPAGTKFSFWGVK